MHRIIKYSLGISASSQDGVTVRLDLPSYLKQPKEKQNIWNNSFQKMRYQAEDSDA